MESETTRQQQLDHIQEAGSKSEGSWFIAEKDIPHDHEAQQRHFLNYVLTKMSQSGLIKLNHITEGNFGHTTITQETFEPSKPHFDKTMISKMIQSYAQELKLQGGINELSIIKSASHETDPKVESSANTQIIDQISRVIEEQSRVPVSMQMTTPPDKRSVLIEEQSEIPVSNWQNTTNLELQSMAQENPLMINNNSEETPLNTSKAPIISGQTNVVNASTLPNQSLVTSYRAPNLDVPMSSMVHETTFSRHNFSKLSSNNHAPDFGFLVIPSPQQRPSKHLKKKKQKPESNFQMQFRITKERQLHKMEPEMTTQSEQMIDQIQEQQIVDQRFETPDQSLRPQLAQASDIIAKMKQYSNSIFQIMAIPEKDEELKITHSERDESPSGFLSGSQPEFPVFRKSQNVGSDLETQTNRPPVDSKIKAQESKQYVVFSDAGSQIESVKTKYGKFNNPTSKNSKMMGSFRAVKNYSIQPPNVNFSKFGPKPNRERSKARRGILAQNLQDLGFDPHETVSYLTANNFLIQIISQNSRILKWHLSPSKNLNLLDVQIFSYPDNLIKSQSISEPQVFQNQFEGIDVDFIKQKKEKSLSIAKRVDECHLKIGSPVILKQLIYVRSINPLKAYTLRYKFFQVGEEILTEHEMIQRYKNLSITAQFNLKISESIEDALRYIKRQSNPFCFQTLTFDFLLNLKSGRPDLIDIQPSCFDQPCENVPDSFRDCILSLLLKIDKQVRSTNGINPNLNYNPTVFRTFWQKVVDYDMTDVDVRYDVPLKAKQVRVTKSPKKSKESDEETQKEYGGIKNSQMESQSERPDEASIVSMPSFVEKIRKNYQQDSPKSEQSSGVSQHSFIISNKDYSIYFSEDEYPDDKVLRIQTFVRMRQARKKFILFKSAIIYIQREFRQRNHYNQSDVDHNWLLMKMVKLSNTLEPFKRHQIHHLQRSFYQIQKVTHEVTFTHQPQPATEIPYKAELPSVQALDHKRPVEVESVTEAAVIEKGVHKNSQPPQRESQQSMYTRLLDSEKESIKGDFPKKVKEIVETPILLSVDKESTKRAPSKMSEQTKGVQFRKNILEKDPFVQYQESKKLRLPEETQFVAQNQNDRISIQMVSEPGSPSRSVQVGAHNLQISENSYQSKKDSKSQRSQKPKQDPIIDSKSSRNKPSQQSQRTQKSVQIKNEELGSKKYNRPTKIQDPSQQNTHRISERNDSKISQQKPSINPIPLQKEENLQSKRPSKAKLQSQISKPNPSPKSKPKPLHTQSQPSKPVFQPIISSSSKAESQSSPDRMGAFSMSNGTPKLKSAMANIIISGSVVMDDESIKVTEKGVQYSIQEETVKETFKEPVKDPVDMGVQCEEPEKESLKDKAVDLKDPAVDEAKEAIVSQEEKQIKEPDSKPEEPQSAQKDQSQKSTKNLNLTQSAVTLASHLRNADDPGDENPVIDHREVGQVFNDAMSLKNEQSDNPVENYKKIRQPVSNQTLPVNENENQDTIQPFQKFGGSKREPSIKIITRAKNTTSQIKENSLSEEQSQKELEQVVSQTSLNQEVKKTQLSAIKPKSQLSSLHGKKSNVSKHVQNIVGELKLRPKVITNNLQIKSTLVPKHNPQLQQSIQKPTLVPKHQLSQSIDLNQNLDYSAAMHLSDSYRRPVDTKMSQSVDYGNTLNRVPSVIYELPKKKKHNMRDAEHVISCQKCLRKQQSRLERESSQVSKPTQGMGPPMNSVRQRYKQNILGRSLEVPERTQRKRVEKKYLLPEIIKQNDERLFIQKFLKNAKEPEELKRQRFLEKKLKEQSDEIEKIRQMQDELLRLSESPRLPQIQSSRVSPEYVSQGLSSPGRAYNPFSHNHYK